MKVCPRLNEFGYICGRWADEDYGGFCHAHAVPPVDAAAACQAGEVAQLLRTACTCTEYVHCATCERLDAINRKAAAPSHDSTVERDAARYRWLRDYIRPEDFYSGVRWTVAREEGGTGQVFRGESLDRAIDTAMAKEKRLIPPSPQEK